MALHSSMTTETRTLSRTKDEVTMHKSDSYDSSTMISGFTDGFHIDQEKIVDIVLLHLRLLLHANDDDDETDDVAVLT